jgi:hypothetical protein
MVGRKGTIMTEMDCCGLLSINVVKDYEMIDTSLKTGARVARDYKRLLL